MLRVAPLVVMVVCCIALLPNSQATSHGASKCNAADTQYLYNHVKAPAIDLSKVDRFKVKKDFDLGRTWYPRKTVSVSVSKLPLSVGAPAKGSLFLSWYNAWDKNPNKKAELAVNNGVWNRVPLIIHPMDQKPGFGGHGKASIYVLERDQDRALTHWIDAVFSCKKIYLDRFLFMDATCVNTPWGPRDYRVIIGTHQGESYIAVIYSSRGTFGGKHFVSQALQGMKEWNHTESSIHLMKITDGTNPRNMDYLPIKWSYRCQPLKPMKITVIETRPAPVHHRKTSPPLNTPPAQNNVPSNNARSNNAHSGDTGEVRKLKKEFTKAQNEFLVLNARMMKLKREFTKMDNKFRVLNARLINLERKTGRK